MASNSRRRYLAETVMLESSPEPLKDLLLEPLQVDLACVVKKRISSGSQKGRTSTKMETNTTGANPQEVGFFIVGKRSSPDCYT